MKLSIYVFFPAQFIFYVAFAVSLKTKKLFNNI